jgi:hypothetical protein
MKKFILVLFTTSFSLAYASISEWKKYEDKTEAILIVDQSTVSCSGSTLLIIVTTKDPLDPFSPGTVEIPLSSNVDCYRQAAHLFEITTVIPVTLIETGETSRYDEDNCEPGKHHGCFSETYRRNEEKFIFIEGLKFPFRYDR